MSEEMKHVKLFNEILNDGTLNDIMGNQYLALYDAAKQDITALLAALKAEKEKVEGMEKAKEDLIRRVESHIKGESCKGFCKACHKPYWNVDDEDMTCPYCGNKDFPVPDIDAQDISRSKDV